MENIIKWNDKDLVIHKVKHSFANGGRLDKVWVEDINSGRQFLVKGSSLFSTEPFSEKIAYIIGKNLGFEVLEYDILPAKLFDGIIDSKLRCKYVSICEKIDRRGYAITSVAEIKRAQNALLESGVKNKQVMYDVLDKRFIDTMLLFDAIIGNRDRHYGNVHILRGKDGEMIPAPLLDNGNSLLATIGTANIALFGDSLSWMFDEALTIDRTHDKQVRTITTLKGFKYNIPVKTINILTEIEPVLNLMEPIRAKYTKRFIIYRLRKYLSLINSN